MPSKLFNSNLEFLPFLTQLEITPLSTATNGVPFLTAMSLPKCPFCLAKLISPSKSSQKVVAYPYAIGENAFNPYFYSKNVDFLFSLDVLYLPTNSQNNIS